ncbi:DUF6241 domain-containing protein [Clostridium sp.]|uniref:DUF6241 domain-containing protein n=1 Tax=Clostridium sp. TaxID=1506 RepID=UPI001A49C63B|nr:DUF6241 domain-containing protein [Clostridium sp.]MBK5240649.1 hypothetical protein [Clostridium sp.]
MHKKLTIKIILGFSTVIVMGAIVVLVAAFNGWDYNKYMGVKPVKADTEVVLTKENTKADTKEDAIVYTAKQNTKVYTRLEVATMIHDMVNTLIIAEDSEIWTKVAVNKESVSELLNMIESTEDFYEKVDFAEIANDWKSGKFDNVVQAHNKVWGILDGTVGRANGENLEAITEAKENLK